MVSGHIAYGLCEVYALLLGAGFMEGVDGTAVAIKGLIDSGKSATKENVIQEVFSHDFMGVAGNRIHFNSDGDNIGQRVYTIYQSQQQPQGTWGWKILTTRQTG